ncbi:MAG: DUF1415 domain-containing protein [Marinobacter sp.]|nr:DUF1415 domain-containing protein [Marinobacter sp.]
MQEQVVRRAVERWVEQVVVGLDLCPFARRELVRGAVRFTVSPATGASELLAELHAELQHLCDHPAVETTLLIHPNVLTDFDDYLDFLADAEELLRYLELEGIFQVASFHPDYQFADTLPEDVSNYTNRSPYPLIHLLREDSLSRAIDGYPDVEGIPERNMARMRQLGAERLQALLAHAVAPGPDAEQPSGT